MLGCLVSKDWFPVLRSEAICDLDLWIWHFQFGVPGVLNDLNTIGPNDHFGNVLIGAFSPASPSYKAESKESRLRYSLMDGIFRN